MAELYRTDIIDVDVSKSLVRSYAGIVLATGDKNANRFGAVVNRAGVPVDLTGCAVTGWFIRPDGDSLACNGVTAGNMAYVDLPAACYTASGSFSLALKISSADITQTVRVIDGCIRLTQTETVVDPDNIVPSLDELLAHIAEMEAATAEAKEVIATSTEPIIAEVTGATVAIADAADRQAVRLVSVITAKQSGSGEPSTDNVRSITGHNAVQLYHAPAYDAAIAPKMVQSLPETVYGGSLDWTTGILTVDMRHIGLTGGESWSYNGTQFITSLAMAGANKVGMCSHYIYKALGTAAAMYVDGKYLAAGKGIADRYASTADWKAFLAAQHTAGRPVQVVYHLAEPYTIQLTAQQLDMIKGNNSLWSDCGETSVTYVADTKLYIDGKFAALQSAILAQGANV